MTGLQDVAAALNAAGQAAMVPPDPNLPRVQVMVGDSAMLWLTHDARGWTYEAKKIGGGKTIRGTVAVDPGALAEDVVAAVLPELAKVREWAYQ